VPNYKNALLQIVSLAILPHWEGMLTERYIINESFSPQLLTPEAINTLLKISFFEKLVQTKMSSGNGKIFRILPFI